MDITALTSAPRAEDVPVEMLADSKSFSEEEKISAVSRQFEAVLLRQILGQARKTIFSSKLSTDSLSSGIYQDMITQQLADGISKSGSFGLARSLEAQLTHQVLPAKDAAAKTSTAPHGASKPLHD